jgi:uncharacterized integral membrane protein
MVFPRQKWLHESASMLRFTYTACLVGYNAILIITIINFIKSYGVKVSFFESQYHVCISIVALVFLIIVVRTISTEGLAVEGYLIL